MAHGAAGQEEVRASSDWELLGVVGAGSWGAKEKEKTWITLRRLASVWGRCSRVLEQGYGEGQSSRRSPRWMRGDPGVAASAAAGAGARWRVRQCSAWVLERY